MLNNSRFFESPLARHNLSDQSITKRHKHPNFFQRTRLRLNLEHLDLKAMDIKFRNKERLTLSLFDKFLLLTRYMYRTEGMPSFWRGLKPNVLRCGLSSGAYFYQLRFYEEQMMKFGFNKGTIDFWSSGVARSITGLLLNPLTIIRTRAELIGCNEFKNVGSSLKKIYMKEGARGMCKGGFLNIVEEFPFGGIFNLVYEMMNRNSGIRFKGNFRAQSESSL